MNILISSIAVEISGTERIIKYLADYDSFPLVFHCSSYCEGRHNSEDKCNIFDVVLPCSVVGGAGRYCCHECVTKININSPAIKPSEKPSEKRTEKQQEPFWDRQTKRGAIVVLGWIACGAGAFILGGWKIALGAILVLIGFLAFMAAACSSEKS